jgi:hypothetical protein
MYTSSTNASATGSESYRNSVGIGPSVFPAVRVVTAAETRCAHRSELGSCRAYAADLRALFLPPHVSVWLWQFGHRSRRFSNRLSSPSPLT